MDKNKVKTTIRYYRGEISADRMEKLLPLIEEMVTIIKSNHLSCYETRAVLRGIDEVLQNTNF